MRAPASPRFQWISRHEENHKNYRHFIRAMERLTSGSESGSGSRSELLRVANILGNIGLGNVWPYFL